MSIDLSQFAIIIDVRSSDDFDKSHIVGAVHIPLLDVMRNRLPDIVNQNKHAMIGIYCNSGLTANAARICLAEQGFNVVNIGSINIHNNYLKQGKL